MAKTRRTASICGVLQCVAVCCNIFTCTFARSTEMHQRVASGESHRYKLHTHQHTYFTFMCMYTYSHAPSLDRQKSTNALHPAHRTGYQLIATGRYFLSTTLVWSGRGRAVEVWRGGTCVYVFVCVSQCVCAWVVECVCVYVRECEYYVGG